MILVKNGKIFSSLFFGQEISDNKVTYYSKKKGEFQDNENYLNIIVKLEFFQRGWPMIFDKK